MTSTALPPPPREGAHWQKHDSQHVHANPWYKVRRDSVTRPDGSVGEYYVMEVGQGVFVAPFTPEGKVLLVKLFRYPTGRAGWEVPAGGVEKGEQPLEAAKRELQEETGLTANEWQELPLAFDAMNGMSDALGHVFIAKSLVATDRHEKDEEGITETRAFSVPEILSLIQAGELNDALSIAALLHAFLALGLISARG